MKIRKSKYHQKSVKVVHCGALIWRKFSTNCDAHLVERFLKGRENNHLLKSLFKLSVIFMTFTASGCTLAVPDAGTDGNGDRLIGAFITSEYLDLYDMEGYLNDHAASLMNNSSITIGNDSRYEGKLVATVDKEGAQSSSEWKISFGDIKGEYILMPVTEDEDGNTFKQISNLQSADGVTKEVNGVTGDTLYNYSESFRFIVSFANIINNNASIKAGSYYSMINILDSESWIDSEQIENTNKINISQVVFKPSSINTELEKYEPNGVVTIKSAGTVQTFNGEGKQLYGNIKIYNAEGKQVDIPIGSEITLNGNTCTIVNGTTQCKFLDNCTDSGTSYNFDFKMDMKNVLEQNQLLAGNYKIKFAYAFAQNDLLNGNIAGWIDVLLTIINYSDNYGIDVSIDNSENLAEDKLQLITKGKEEFRIIHTNCSGQLEDPFVKVSVVEKTSNFDYSATENSKKITVNDNGDGSYKVTFSDSLDVGTYRVIFELFDKYGNKMSENFANFIVVDKPNI